MTFRFWLLVLDLTAWLSRQGNRLYLWAVAKASAAARASDDARAA